MTGLTNRRILLGVAGGIAAYKSAELIRRLRDAGADVRVVMTHAATEFITPLTLQALSGHPVHRTLLDPEAEAAMGHIELARWADLVLIAPATADLMARLADGRGDDLLTALCLATAAPLVLAPAMNQGMWQHPATRANATRLQERGVSLLGPAEGSQACGETGPGRLLEPEAIIATLGERFQRRELEGVSIVITAGPTREALDPVRYLSNHSSGRMGFALARAAADAGARTTLIAGPTTLPTPERVQRRNVVSADDMLTATLAALPCDIFIAAAAVADYRPAESATQKIKKQADSLSLTLVRNPDILATVANQDSRPFCVGFAAETENLIEHARTKLESKGLDMIIANDVGQPDTGFNSEENAVTIVDKQGETALTRAAKQQLAVQLIQRIAAGYQSTVA